MVGRASSHNHPNPDSAGRPERRRRSRVGKKQGGREDANRNILCTWLHMGMVDSAKTGNPYFRYLLPHSTLIVSFFTPEI